MLNFVNANTELNHDLRACTFECLNRQLRNWHTTEPKHAKDQRIRRSQVNQREREWRMVSGRGGKSGGGASAHLPAGRELSRCSLG